MCAESKKLMHKEPVEIIPAFMPKSYDDLARHMGLFAGVAPLVQLDIMDGKFVPDVTWPYNVRKDPRFEAIVSQDEGMPEWEYLDIEVDLMVENPEAVIEQWIAIGARRIIVHAESMTDFELIRALIPEGFVELGLAINTTTPADTLTPYLDRIDFVQCMGIARIGFQGEPFDERVLEQIHAVKALRADIPISIDGSVNLDTARRLVDAGATRLVAGSAIVKRADVSDAIIEFRNLVS